MKNKDKYDLSKLVFTKRKIRNDYTLEFAYDIKERNGNIIARVKGGALSDVMAWLERESNE